MIEIITDRLLLREHRESGLEYFHAWISVPEVMRFVGFPLSGSLAESRQRLSQIIQAARCQDRKQYFFAIVTKHNNSYIGDTGLTILNQQQDSGIAENGYFLLPTNQKQGYAVEAVKAVLDFGFTELKLHKIIAHCDKRNTSSENVMFRCGMVNEGDFRLHRFAADGVWTDELVYAIVKWDR